MLHLYPAHAQQSAKIIGIDPGTQTLGLCCIDFDTESLSINSVHAETYIGDKLDPMQWMRETHSDRFARINAHRRNLVEKFNLYHPSWIRCESPFFNTKRPQAFAALIEIVSEIRYAVCEYDRLIPLELIDPPSAKKVIGAAGNADKDKVFSAILKIDELRNNSDKPLEVLDEHSIDAMAIAYSKLVEYRTSTMTRWV